MTGKVLVTYASRTGTTKGVAEFIGKTLVEEGVSAEVLPMNDVNDLSSYKAVIAGSAVQANRWLPEAFQFIETRQSELNNIPIAIFTVCMTLAMPNGGKYRSVVAQWVEPVRRLVRPVDEAYFAGALDISRIPARSGRFKFRLSVFLGVWKTGDHRDWVGIRAWAKKLQKLVE